MKAEIIAIGTELIIGHTVNTNATYISEKLNEIGINVHYHTSVGDNHERIHNCLNLAASRSDLIICTGGLGPTDDDISHDVIAKFMNQELYEDPKQKTILENKFKSSGRTEIPAINYRQARIIDDAQIIPNPRGTAIGFLIEFDKQFISNDPQYTESPKTCLLASFPGVPSEMQAMLKETLLPYLSQRLSSKAIIKSKKIHLFNISESQMAQNILDYFQTQGLPNPFLEANPSLAPYANLGECYLRITAKAETETQATEIINKLEKKIQAIFPDKIYGYDEDNLEKVLARLLINKQQTLSFAESCTGGLASKLMTDLAGSSQYTLLNLVTYSNQAKEELLGVKAEILNQYGAVSLECAEAMALGLNSLAKADFNVSITGIAGPDGGSEAKPIGTVFCAIASKNTILWSGQLDWVYRKLTREQVRELACKKIFFILINLLNQ